MIPTPKPCVLPKAPEHFNRLPEAEQQAFVQLLADTLCLQQLRERLGIGADGILTCAYRALQREQAQ